MAFTLQEKERIRYHLGYLNVTTASSITFGVPTPLQTLFIVDSAMDRVLPEGEDRVRTFVNILDGIECKMVEGQDFLPANRLGDLEIRVGHIDQLEEEYTRFAGRLADQLGVPLYPYSTKFKRPRGRAGNVDVTN